MKKKSLYDYKNKKKLIKSEKDKNIIQQMDEAFKDLTEDEVFNYVAKKRGLG